MKVKAARDVLDYSGRRRTEFVEADVVSSNFDPAGIVRKVVEIGSFDTNASEMEPVKIDGNDISRLALSFSAGRRFLSWKAHGIVKMIACEFIPACGLQYVIYGGKGREKETWVKTDTDLMSEAKIK